MMLIPTNGNCPQGKRKTRRNIHASKTDSEKTKQKTVVESNGMVGREPHDVAEFTWPCGLR